jgi:hypothetical protein
VEGHQINLLSSWEMRPKTLYSSHWRSKWVGSAFDYHFNDILNSAKVENILGAPYPRDPKKTYFLDIPNFKQTRDVRLREVRSLGVVGGPMLLNGDEGQWTFERDYLAAGSCWFRNKMTQTLEGLSMPVSVMEDINKATQVL